MKRVLVTGGAGYIGSHTSKVLAARGYEPVVLDDLSAGHRWAVRWGPLIECNIADSEMVATAIKTHRIDAIIHFAAKAYVGESMVKPREYFHNNVVNTLSLLNTMVDCGVRDVVFSSSCATYGNPLSLPISELHPQAPVNPYGESKLFVERVLGWYGQAYGVRSVCLRYFNAAGADPDGEIGEFHNPETHLIPLTIGATQRGQSSLQIFGTDYQTADGTAVRDYVHVCDLADAHLRALEYLAAGGESTAFNLGTGTGQSVLDVRRVVENVSGLQVRTELRPRRTGDPATLVATAEKARKLLGWEPRFRDLESIVETAWRWHNVRESVVTRAV